MNPHIQREALSTASAVLDSPPIVFDCIFSHLPSKLESAQVPEFLYALTQAVENLAACASEADLKHFVQWALAQSYSEQLNYVERMRLLELAWQVQKLLWAEA